MSRAETKCLFVNPRDLVGASPFTKLAECAGVLLQNGFDCEIAEPAASSLSNEEIALKAKTNAYSLPISDARVKCIPFRTA